MADKHYDITYLQNTVRLLKSLKDHSYTFFQDIDSGSVIDLGCGAGNDVIELSKMLGEQVKVIGVDHDPVMLEQGRTQSQALAVNTEFILSEAFPLPFQNDAIAGLRSERLIQHLQHPEKVFADIHRILADGAPLVIIETDWHSLSFYTEFVDTGKKINAYLTDVKVNNGFAARRITSYLQSLDFKDIQFEIHPFIVNSLEEANEYFWIDRIVKEAAELGYISEAERKDFYEALQSSDEKSYFSCSINLVIASCIK